MNDRAATTPMPGYYYNGTILTQSPACPVAPHMLVAGSKIWFCGDGGAPLGLDFRRAGFAESRRSLAKDVRFIDLGGKTIVPGLTDAHSHFLWWTINASRPDLSSSTSEAHAVELLVQKTKDVPPGQWIVGFGWSHNLWESQDLPGLASLDAAFPDNPIFLHSKCCHLGWVNSAALARAGMDANMPDPAGGEITRITGSDGRRRFTGILKENACGLVESVIPQLNERQREAAFEIGQKSAHALGLTGVHAPEELESFALFQRMLGQDKLTMRINYLVPNAALDHLEALRIQPGDRSSRLRIAGVKAFVDGSLGGRTSWMYEDIEGEPGNLGIPVNEPKELESVALRTNRLGLPVAIHAIGDRAVGDLLRIFRNVREQLTRDGITQHIRNRIEHFQLFSDRDMDLIRSEKPVASVQPVHLCADMGPADKFWGKRSRYAYAFDTLAKAGCTLAFGSDAPVEPISPFYGMYAAITRSDLTGNPPQGWYPEEKLTAKDALAAYTTGPALAAGQADVVGTLSAGKLADFVVLDENPLEVAPQALRDFGASATFVEGACVHGGE